MRAGRTSYLVMHRVTINRRPQGAWKRTGDGRTATSGGVSSDTKQVVPEMLSKEPMKGHQLKPRRWPLAAGVVRLAIVGMGSLLLTGAAPPVGSAGSTLVVLQLLRRGQVRLAHRRVVDQLTLNPEDADLHALYGAVLQQMGHHSDSDVAFRMALGSDWYESRGLPYHASALAILGEAERAFELRQSFELAGVRPDEASLGTRLKQVDDYLAGGRPELALEQGEHLLGEYPASPIAHAEMALVQVALGDIDLAGWHMLRAEALGAAGSKRVRSARATWLTAVGAYSSAWKITEELRMRNPHDAVLWSLRMRILRMWNRAEDAVLIAELDRFKNRRDPTFLVEAARCYAAAGDLALARGLRDELLIRYSRHPHVQALSDELDVAP